MEMSVQGFVASACGGSENADARLRWSVITSFDRRLTPGRRYASFGDVLTPGENFKSSHVAFVNSWFFVVDTAGSDVSCTSSESCPTGASCLTADEMGLSAYYYSPSRFCVYPTEVSVLSDPTFTHFREDFQTDNARVMSDNALGRSIGFILDNSSTWDGSTNSGVVDASSATDPWEYRKVGLNDFMDGLAMTEESSPRYEFSAHFANGSGENGVYEASSTWMRSIAQWNAKVMSQYPTPSGGSPIWETANAAVEKMTGEANASYTHALVALTDGAPNAGTEDVLTQFRTRLMATGRIALHWLELTLDDVHAPYAEIVKLGCGTHYIFDNPVFFSKIMRHIAINSESHWDVDVSFSASLPENQTYRLATTIVVTLGNSAVSYEAQRMNDEAETLDYRLIYSR